MADETERRIQRTADRLLAQVEGFARDARRKCETDVLCEPTFDDVDSLDAALEVGDEMTAQSLVEVRREIVSILRDEVAAGRVR